MSTGIDFGSSPIQGIPLGRSGAAMFSLSGRTRRTLSWGRPVGGPPKEDSVSNDVWQRIEQARDRWNVLEHPFYQRWSAGELSREELAHYSGQYRHATAALARLSADVADSAPDSERSELRRHAEEEASHIALWDGFVEAVGGEVAAAPTAETQGVRRRLDGERRPRLPARPPLRDRERPAGDLEDQARGPRRPLRDRRRPRQRVLPRPRGGRRRARRRGRAR